MNLKKAEVDIPMKVGAKQMDVSKEGKSVIIHTNEKWIAKWQWIYQEYYRAITRCLKYQQNYSLEVLIETRMVLEDLRKKERKEAEKVKIPMEKSEEKIELR